MNKIELLTACCLGLWIHNWIQAQTEKTQNQIQQVYISEDGRDTLFLPVKNEWNNIQQDSIESFLKKEYIIVNNDLPEEIENHENFITTRVDKIFKLYWKEKGLELINQHMLIEINKFREENWRLPLKLDSEIQELSQARAEHLYDENSCEHWKWSDSLRARIQQKSIKWVIGAWENICQWFYTIEDGHIAFITSETGHRDLLLLDEVNFCWVGVKCSDFWNNDETGNTVFIWDGIYYQSNNIFRVYFCVTIVQKEESVQDEKTNQTEE